MSSLDYLDLCRLCLVKDRVSVPIFEGEGDVRQIFLKIAACLPVKVTREDKLPKKICDDCVYKVELFYQFWNTTVNAEKQLLQWLGEVSLEDKQGYVTNVLNPSVMKQEQNTENRLDGNVMQQVGEHQNNMGMGMMDNMGLGIPMIISSANQQQITSVPMDTSGNSVQTVQAVPGPSSQTTHNQIPQNQTSSTQQEEEEESSEDEENSDEECDGDEGLPVKEESEEDPSNRTIEPTTFVNVSLACDEAGPSGLQQQKISDMPEMPIPQPADGDPKSGSTPRDPLEQTYLVVQNVDKYFLLPVEHNVPTQKVPEQVVIAPETNVKSEVQEDLVEEMREPPANEEVKPDDRSRIPSALPIQLPLQLSQWLDRYSSPKDTSTTKTMSSEKIFTCDYCPKAFRKKYSLRRHQATHSSTRSFECSVCHQLLKTKRTLRFHMMLHEDSGKIFQCTDCGFMSKRNHSLKRHQIRIHSKYFNYKCSHCPKMFKLNADLKRHQMKHVVAPCCCEVCGKMYQNEFFLRVHRTMGKNRRTDCCVRRELIKSNHEVTEYTAVQNGRIIVKATSSRSKKGDVKRVFKCSQCKWRFSSWKLLRKHTQRHFLSYNCETCGAVFKYKASFLKHQDSHKEEQL